MKTKFLITSITLIFILTFLNSCKKEKSLSSSRIKCIVAVNNPMLDSVTVDTIKFNYDMEGRIVDIYSDYTSMYYQMNYNTSGSATYSDIYSGDWNFFPYSNCISCPTNAFGLKIGHDYRLNLDDTFYIIDDTTYLQGFGQEHLIEYTNNEDVLLEHESNAPNTGSISDNKFSGNININTIAIADQPQIEAINFCLLRYFPLRFFRVFDGIEDHYQPTLPEMVVFGKLFTNIQRGSQALHINYNVLGDKVNTFTVSDGSNSCEYQIFYE